MAINMRRQAHPTATPAETTNFLTPEMTATATVEAEEMATMAIIAIIAQEATLQAMVVVPTLGGNRKAIPPKAEHPTPPKIQLIPATTALTLIINLAIALTLITNRATSLTLINHHAVVSMTTILHPPTRPTTLTLSNRLSLATQRSREVTPISATPKVKTETLSLQ